MPSLISLRDEIILSITKASSICIMSHINPDGDGFCASLALQRLFRTMGHKSVIVVDQGSLMRYEHLMKDARIELYTDELNFDLVVVLDCNSTDRLGERKQFLASAGKVILIDHHVPEHNLINADYSFIETSFVSVGAIVHQCFKDDIAHLPEPDRLFIAENLYTSILNDTNNYANANTNAEVFRIASEITQLGIHPHLLYKQYFLNQTASEMRYTGQVLSTIELHLNKRILFMDSTLEMLQENELDDEDVMNITRWVQGVKGLEAIVYFREEAPNLYKLSLRSVRLNVNQIAVKYGGGGHRSASGAHYKGELSTIKKELLEEFSRALDTIDK